MNELQQLIESNLVEGRASSKELARIRKSGIQAISGDRLDDTNDYTSARVSLYNASADLMVSTYEVKGTGDTLVKFTTEYPKHLKKSGDRDEKAFLRGVEASMKKAVKPLGKMCGGVESRNVVGSNTGLMLSVTCPGSEAAKLPTALAAAIKLWGQGISAVHAKLR